MIPTKTPRLRIFAEDDPQPKAPENREPGRLAEIIEAFRQATGWSLEYRSEILPSQPNDLTWSAPANPGVGKTLGHLRLDSVGPTDSKPASPPDREAASRLAEVLSGLVEDLAATQRALRKREAELAGRIPTPASRPDADGLAARLNAALRAGAEGVGCQAAALYLLDDATTRLKLRACWGLPTTRLVGPPRPLEGSLADLEAMLGHAVVLESEEIQKHFHAPEDFPSAVCVPVSTPTTILGTLWVFSGAQRDFNDRQTNVIELAAGRIAADLERESLISDGIDTADWKRQLAAAERLQRHQLPTIPPLLDGWDVAGWTAQAHAVGGDFFDWFGLPDGLVGVAVGHCMQRGLEAALSASTLKAALRSHGQYHREVDALIRQVNLTLWQGSAGDQYASLFCGLLETATGQIRYCSGGETAIVLLRPGQWESLGQTSPSLGESPETQYPVRQCALRPGEALVVFTEGFRAPMDGKNGPPSDASLAEQMCGSLDLSAQELLCHARRELEARAPAVSAADRTILVVKRTAP